jgi:hypothetical protein
MSSHLPPKKRLPRYTAAIVGLEEIARRASSDLGDPGPEKLIRLATARLHRLHPRPKSVLTAIALLHQAILEFIEGRPESAKNFVVLAISVTEPGVARLLHKASVVVSNALCDESVTAHFGYNPLGIVAHPEYN